MNGLQLKSNPPPVTSSEEAAAPATSSGGPPPLPTRSTPSLNVPPPPPPPGQANPSPPLPTPTSVNASLQPQKSGNGAAKVIVWLLVILAVNGIGFGIYWFTRGSMDEWMTGTLEEMGEEMVLLEEETWDVEIDPAMERVMYEEAYQIDWPVLVLSGMVAGSTDEKTSAILNGSLVSLRQGIEGATLIEVRSDGVVLQYDRTRKFIRVGEST